MAAQLKRKGYVGLSVFSTEFLSFMAFLGFMNNSAGTGGFVL